MHTVRVQYVAGAIIILFFIRFISMQTVNKQHICCWRLQSKNWVEAEMIRIDREHTFNLDNSIRFCHGGRWLLNHNFITGDWRL